MKNCIIIEDLRPEDKSLGCLIETYFSSELCVAGTAHSVKTGLELIGKKSPDLVFLDLELQGESGLQLMECFYPVPFNVIFMASDDEYALTAIKYSAIDYLIKPVSVMDMKAALIRYFNKNMPQFSYRQIRTLLNLIKMENRILDKIALPISDGFRVLKTDEILYCLASENYCFVHTFDGERILVSRSLKAMEELLDLDFFRIHKSTLINLNYVKSYSRKDGSMVTMETGLTFEVATRRQEEFSSLFLKKTSGITRIENINLISN